MFFTDTHCHLNFKAFENGHKKIIQRAMDESTKRFIVPGTDIETSKKAVEIAEECEGVFAVCGIHPHHASIYPETVFRQEIDSDLTTLKELIHSDKVVGIGEIGLDRHIYRSSRHGDSIVISDKMLDIQKFLFRSQVEIARQKQVSLVIHNREADIEIVGMLSEMMQNDLIDPKKTVLHCCEAKKSLLELILHYGFFVGVDGDVTYDEIKKSFIEQIPLENIVLETDAPYILPEPLKSQRKYPNTPANIIHIARSVATIKRVSLEHLAEATNHNADLLFALK
jgi:TatD DNase family protein